MKRKMKNSVILFLAFFVIVGCDNDGRGYEYMPDMYRSPSLETYGQNNIFNDRLKVRIVTSLKKVYSNVQTFFMNFYEGESSENR